MNRAYTSPGVWVLMQALLILAGCAATEPKPAPPVLALETCAAAAAAPLDARTLDTSHKTLGSLVDLGEAARGRLLSTQCAYGNAAKRSAYLLAVGRRLKTDLSAYLESAEAWQQAYGRLDQQLKDYYQRCLGEPLDAARFQACSADSAGLDRERQELDEQAAPLQQRNQGLTAAVIQYRGDVRDSERASEEARQDYTRAMQDYGRWLVQAYVLSITPAVRPYAGEDGCPVVAEPPQTPEAMLSLGGGMLDCFRKILGAPGADSLPGSEAPPGP